MDKYNYQYSRPLHMIETTRENAFQLNSETDRIATERNLMSKRSPPRDNFNRMLQITNSEERK